MKSCQTTMRATLEVHACIPVWLNHIACVLSQIHTFYVFHNLYQGARILLDLLIRMFFTKIIFLQGCQLVEALWEAIN